MVGQAHGVVQRVLQLYGSHVAPVVGRGVYIAQNVVAQVAGYAGGGRCYGVQREFRLPASAASTAGERVGLGVSPPTATRAAVQRGA